MTNLLDLVPAANPCDVLRRSTAISLLEGLPHQHFERDLLATELLKPAVRTVGGFPFYDEALPLLATDETFLFDVLSEPRTYQPYSGPKFCGGFHPDFAIEWRSGQTLCWSFICFGCAEIKSSAPEFEMHHDLNQATWVRLHDQLRTYRRNRPGKIPPPLPELLREHIRRIGDDA